MEKQIEPMPKDVKALEGYLLYIKFKNGEEKIYDMNEILKFDYYKNLRNREIFKTVKAVGVTLQWITGEDIAPEKIYFDSIPLEDYKFEFKEMK